ncbi:MAG: hypothetical protein IK119_01860, partial [Bacteroidales bacterium]|nr:hypothetical protein [Bacteroidales bacterium]
MDYSTAISNYIKPPKAVRIVAWALLALFIVGLVLGATISGNGDDRSSAVKFNNSAASGGDYCYIDVVGLSDWLYKYDSSTYYTVLDKDGNYAIVILKSSEVYAMSAQRTYWDSDDDAIAPEPYRIYGLSVKISDSAKKAIAEVWGMSQVEYSTYFGKLFMNTSGSPSGTKSSVFFIIAFISLMGWIGTGLFSVISRSKAKKALSRLETEGRMEAAGSQ